MTIVWFPSNLRVVTRGLDGLQLYALNRVAVVKPIDGRGVGGSAIIAASAATRLRDYDIIVRD